MNLGKWKTLFTRWYYYVGLFVYINTLLSVTGNQIPLMFLLPIEIAIPTFIMWRFDTKRIMQEEMDYNYRKSNFVTDWRRENSDILKGIDEIKRRLDHVPV